MNIVETLIARDSTHGDFPRRAEVEQALIEIIERSDMWPSFEPFQRSAARMIAVKLSRLLSGNPDHIDSWHDIAGYAQLVADHLAARIEAHRAATTKIGAVHESRNSRTKDGSQYGGEPA